MPLFGCSVSKYSQFAWHRGRALPPTHCVSSRTIEFSLASLSCASQMLDRTESVRAWLLPVVNIGGPTRQSIFIPRCSAHRSSLLDIEQNPAVHGGCLQFNRRRGTSTFGEGHGTDRFQ